MEFVKLLMIFLMSWQRKACQCQYDEGGQIFQGDVLFGRGHHASDLGRLYFVFVLLVIIVKLVKGKIILKEQLILLKFSIEY